MISMSHRKRMKMPKRFRRWTKLGSGEAGRSSFMDPLRMNSSAGVARKIERDDLGLMGVGDFLKAEGDGVEAFIEGGGAGSEADFCVAL